MVRLFMLAVLAAFTLVSAQDGIYGTFLVGQKFVNLSPMNDAINNELGIPGEMFPNNNWTIGGEGHLILGKFLVVGGKAFGVMHERVIPTAIGEPVRRIRLTGGMGVGTVGLNLFPPNSMGLHLYPQIGLGASSFLYQSKREMTEEQKTFNTILVGKEDNIETVGKMGLILDFAANLEWYLPFKNFFTVVPGLDFGILFHAEAGYSLLPGDLKWRRDFDLKGKDQVEGGPDLKFNGFYFNFGFGFGLSAPDDKK